MHTRQGVAEPAQSKNSAAPTLPRPDSDYEENATRRATLHASFWSEEPLTSWQEFILCRELNCGDRPIFSTGAVRP